MNQEDLTERLTALTEFLHGMNSQVLSSGPVKEDLERHLSTVQEARELLSNSNKLRQRAADLR